MPDLLELEALSSGYGESVVVDKVSLRLPAGTSLALLGRNGVGKTALIMTLMGLTRRHGGAIRWQGRDLTGLATHERARLGIGWVPQERHVFPSLTVDEHLTLIARPGPWTAERVYAAFPALAARSRNFGGQLSGGEQQMLAIARALMVNPRLLLLDEPLEGLAPVLVEDLLQVLRRLAREEGLAMIVAEQNAPRILGFMDQAVILERGRVVHRSSAAALLADRAALESHLGIVDKTEAGGNGH